MAVRSIRNSFFLMMAATAAAHAASDTCDGLRLLEQRSRGVTVLVDTCPEGPEIAPGTILRLAPGGRLWLSAAADHRQLVCQSQADAPLALLIDRPSPPWLSSGALKDCRREEGRLLCDSSRGKRNALVCLLTRAAAPVAETRPHPGTSLVLRALPQTDTGLADLSRRQGILAELQGEAALCHQLYQDRTTAVLTWSVTREGKVETVNVPQPFRRTHPRLASCLADLVYSYPYPPSSRTVVLSAPL